MKAIQCFVRVVGGKLLTAANAHLIRARATYPTDRYGNRLPKGVSAIYELRNDAAYFQEWRVVRDKKGFSFREVNHGRGICGAHKSVRNLVIATAGIFGPHLDIVIEVEDAQPGDNRLRWQEHFRAMDGATEMKWRRRQALPRVMKVAA